jgi:hypothetical protein
MPIKVTGLGGWWDRSGNEIDICGQSKESLLLGEVRWRKEPVDYSDAVHFHEKRHLVQCTSGQRANTTMFFVSKSGFENKAKLFLEEHGIFMFDLKDVTAAYDKLPRK